VGAETDYGALPTALVVTPVAGERERPDSDNAEYHSQPRGGVVSESATTPRNGLELSQAQP
jgi:hypothetical protein